MPKSDLWSLAAEGAQRQTRCPHCLQLCAWELIGHTFSLGGGQTIAFRAMERECRVLGSSLSMRSYCSWAYGTKEWVLHLIHTGLTITQRSHNLKLHALVYGCYSVTCLVQISLKSSTQSNRFQMMIMIKRLSKNCSMERFDSFSQACVHRHIDTRCCTISKRGILFVIKKGSHGYKLRLEVCIRMQKSHTRRFFFTREPCINFRVQRKIALVFIQTGLVNVWLWTVWPKSSNYFELKNIYI